MEPAPCELAEINALPNLRLALDRGLLTQENIVEEIQGLIEHGYISDLRPGRAPLLRLTARGRDQAKRDSDLDEYIWGQYASKFAGPSPARE